jgi:hypothetical protein
MRVLFTRLARPTFSYPSTSLSLARPLSATRMPLPTKTLPDDPYVLCQQSYTPIANSIYRLVVRPVTTEVSEQVLAKSPWSIQPTHRLTEMPGTALKSPIKVTSSELTIIERAKQLAAWTAVDQHVKTEHRVNLALLFLLYQSAQLVRL